jgi:hypothetical protein
VNDILGVTTSWWSLPVGLLIVGLSLGFMPSFLLRQIVRLYPKGDERRTELFAELRALPYLKRIVWVSEQLETGIVDGRRARRTSATTLHPQTAEVWLGELIVEARRDIPIGNLEMKIIRYYDQSVNIVILGVDGKHFLQANVPDIHCKYFSNIALYSGFGPGWIA